MTREELRACYEQHHHRLYLAALAVTLDRQTAEDAVHNALVRLLARRRRPDDEAFAGLHPAEREAILLHVYGGMSFREIAGMRRRSINSVAAWYRRGLEKLRKFLRVEHE